MQTSMARTAPVRPVPGLQWITMGDLFSLDWPFRASSSKAIIVLPSGGTPVAGQELYHKWVTSRTKLSSIRFS